MAEVSVDRIWDGITERVGDDLRGITRYEGTDLETRLREDVRDQYTRTEDKELVDNMIIDQLRLKETEIAFKTGQRHGLVRIFDEAWFLSWADSLEGKSGVVVSIQRNGTESMDVLEWCIRYLNEEIDPLLS
jgi:hypothetical protein